MSKLDVILEQPARQLSIDEYLALDRDESPQVITAGGQRGAPQASEIGPGSHQADSSVTDEGTKTHNGGCEFESLCHSLRGVNLKKREFPYRCGWLATNVVWCAKRRQLLEGGNVPK